MDFSNLCVDALFRNLSGNLVGADRMFDGAFPESEEGSDEGQGNGHAEPERQEGHQGEEGNGGRWSFVPEDQVHDEEEGKDNSEE